MDERKVADMLHAWSENSPDPDYFFGAGDTTVFSMMQDTCADGARIIREMAAELAALRATGAGRAEAEAAEPAGVVRPPGETLWLAYGAMFGAANGDWDDLALIDKLRWASVEDSAVRNLLAQSAIRALPAQTAGGAGE